MNIRFNVKGRYEGLENTEIALIIHIDYDANNQEQQKTINYIVNDNDNMGFLGKFTAQMKFGYGSYESPYSRPRIIHSNSGVSISFALSRPGFGKESLLILLSMIGDTMSFLEGNGTHVESDMLGLLKIINTAYKQNEEGGCECAKMIEQLIIFIEKNPAVTHHDAILLAYCFLSFPELLVSDIPLKNKPHEFYADVIDLIRKCYTPKPEPAEKNERNTAGENDEKLQKINKKNKRFSSSLKTFLDKLILCQKIKLFQPCLGKVAHDKGVYRWSYTEWYSLLRDANWQPTSQGQIVINVARDAMKNKSYKSWYAPGKEMHSLFEPESIFLAPLIGLAFADKINFHDQIFFEPASCEKLYQLKLFFDIEAIKKLVQARNHYRLFAQATRSGDMENLPADTIKLIFTFAYGALISEEELTYPKYVGEVLQNANTI